MEELKQKIVYTILLLIAYRIGSFVVLPGIDAQILSEKQGDATGITALINVFAGGAFSRASIFALGIMPYISASIVIQILTIAVPTLARLQKDGESGRKKLNQYTRLLTIVVTLFQAPGYIATQIPDAAKLETNSQLWWVSTLIILVSGTMFVLWLGERITDRGIGNGVSLIIAVGIIARFPEAILSEFDTKISAGSGGGLVLFLVEMVALFLVVVLNIMLVQGVRKIQVQFAKRVVGSNDVNGARQYIPLKVNASGVMPIIFAQAIMFLPAAVSGFTESKSLNAVATALMDYTGFWHNLLFAVLIIAFTYFYTAIMINPKNMADDMKRNNGFIPGVKPGDDTATFIDQIMSFITLPGALFLSLIAILPAFASLAGVSGKFAAFYGGTSLLILVGVVLDTLQQIESYLLVRHYDGLMKEGRVQGRTADKEIAAV
ncbi:MAG: preprotein translocase subunit SecY [Bacteroidia bacterium]